MLVPGMDHIAPGRYAAQDEAPALIRLRCPGRRHGDDEAHHHRVNVAVDRIHARSREGRGPGRAAPVQAEIEWPELDVREDVVAERILVRESDCSPGENDRDMWQELATLHRDHARAHARDVAHRDRALAWLEIHDRTANVALLATTPLLDTEDARYAALSQRQLRQHDQRRAEHDCFACDIHLLKLESEDQVEVPR